MSSQHRSLARTYVALGDQTVLDAARSDPTGFIRGLDRATIDEVQRAPDLLLAIKRTVDEDYDPGRFLLTGSANPMTLPRVADSLAGRIDTIRMLPLARAEVAVRAPIFLERLFEGKLRGDREAAISDDLVGLALLGGYPEAIAHSPKSASRTARLLGKESLKGWVNFGRALTSVVRPPSCGNPLRGCGPGLRDL